MKLIEKKCPNCGAKLSFNENDKNVHCEYCNANYEVKKDDTKIDNSEEDYDLVKIKKFASTIFTWFAFSSVVPFIIFLFIFGMVVFMIIMGIGNFIDSNKNFLRTNPIVEQKKDKYVTEISQIDEKTLEIIQKESLKKLNNQREFISSDIKSSDWTYVGMYLLVNKDDSVFFDRNALYDVYKKSYNGGSVNMEVYATIRYEDLKLMDDGKVSTSYNGYTYAPMLFVSGGHYYYVNGYDSNEDLFNKVIRNKISDYNISSTNGLYVES